MLSRFRPWNVSSNTGASVQSVVGNNSRAFGAADLLQSRESGSAQPRPSVTADSLPGSGLRLVYPNFVHCRSATRVSQSHSRCKTIGPTVSGMSRARRSARPAVGHDRYPVLRNIARRMRELFPGDTRRMSKTWPEPRIAEVVRTASSRMLSARQAGNRRGPATVDNRQACLKYSGDSSRWCGKPRASCRPAVGTAYQGSCASGNRSITRSFVRADARRVTR